MYIGLHGLNNSIFTSMEVKATNVYKFGEERFRKHDLEKVVFYYAVHVAIT